MQIRTYTNFFNFEKKLYSINDIPLPVPISVRVLGVFALGAIPWDGLMFFLHTPFSNGLWAILWLGPPAGLAALAAKPWFQDKSIWQYARSQIFYFFVENRHYKGLTPNLHGPKSSTKVAINLYTRDVSRRKNL